ncbi:hypothetical protein Sjap_009627 [Stephania japonica]|uniref:Mitochondrial glycoprotein n=1 Tax=Stephania japonica TaxID=461633 RepID=A0AAP0J8V6_9MAGN
MMMRSAGGRLLCRGRTLLLVASSRFSLLPPPPPPPPPPFQHQSFYSLPHVSSPFTSLPLRFLSSSSSAAPMNKVSADDKLRKVVQSEIDCAESDNAQQDQVVFPANFPFEIVDNPGEQTITLKRSDIAGETILVEVHSPNAYDDEDEDVDDDDKEQSENDDNSDQFTISLTVTVVKGDGPRLEFSCTLSPDQISIDTMLIKDPAAASASASTSDDQQILYEGPEFSDLDENLQKAFYTYLEDRGIKSSLTNFLQEYMSDKENREYLTWLKSMKEFVEK